MLEDQFHFQLLKCFNQQKRWINQQTNQIDVLPGQSKFLLCLKEYGPLSPKELGNHCCIDKSTTTTLLNKMEKMNYIEKKNQNQDKRSIQIHLTKRGYEKALQVEKISNESEQLFLSTLSKEDQVKIIQLLKQINLFMEGELNNGNTK